MNTPPFSHKGYYAAKLAAPGGGGLEERPPNTNVELQKRESIIE